MDKQAKLAHEQKVINNLHHKLFQVEMRLKQGVTGTELHILERRRVDIEARLMELYHTEKYGHVS